MAFEVAEYNSEVIFGIRLSHDIVFQMFAVFERKLHFAVGIHYVYGGDGCEAMVGGSLPVVVG